MRVSLLLAFYGLLHAASATTFQHRPDVGPSIRQLYEFPYSIFLENLTVRPNGHLLINTFDDARIFGLDPSTQNILPTVVAQLYGVTAGSGIVQVAPDVFVTSGGILNVTTGRTQKGSAKIFLLEPIKDEPSFSVSTIAAVPDTESLNGMVSLPLHPRTVLSVDSLEGRIFRINTSTKDIDVVFQHPMLGLGNFTMPGALGGNGLKIHDGYLYFTNSIQQFFGRIKIEPDGSVTGGIEEILSFAGLNQLRFDDFAITKTGDSYIAAHPNTLVKVSRDGNETLITGDDNNLTLLDPTSAALSRDEKKLYLITAGSLANGTTTGGQIVELQL